MKKITVILFLAAFCSAQASGQFFSNLFKKQKQAAATERPALTTDTTTLDVSLADTLAAVAADSSDYVTEYLSDEMASHAIDTVRMGLFLPFNASSAPNDSNLDFLSGVIMAAIDLGNEGISLVVNTYDISDKLNPITGEDLESNDVLIGPIAPADIKEMYGILPEDRYFVSPLDQKAFALTDSLRVIHAPVAWNHQATDLMDWALGDLGTGDALVFVRESGKQLGESFSLILDSLKARNVGFSDISYGVAQGADRTRQMFSDCAAQGNGVTRIILASEDPVFATDVMRNAGILKAGKHEVVLYGPSKIRSFETVDLENLHKASAHLCANYAIDYTDPKLVSFIMAYRTMFHMEPNSFVFQGYDLALFLTRACKLFGTQWVDCLPEMEHKGFQTDFKFIRNGKTGLENTAVRHQVYNQDFSVSVD